MRAFLAVDLHATLGPVAHDWGQQVARALGPRQASSLTWVAAGRVHVTLRFFGELSRREVDAAVDALAAEPPALAPFELALEGAGTFPERGRPRVLWLGFSRGRHELQALAAWARQRLAGIGREEARETFSPHLTVARVRRDTTPGLGNAVREAAARTPVPREATRVERVTLMESVLSPRGPTYRPIAEFPFSPR
jgi:2'-5' RNA ligase